MLPPFLLFFLALEKKRAELEEVKKKLIEIDQKIRERQLELNLPVRPVESYSAGKSIDNESLTEKKESNKENVNNENVDDEERDNNNDDDDGEEFRLEKKRKL